MLTQTSSGASKVGDISVPGSRVLFRKELKYLMYPAERIRFERALQHYMDLDPYCVGLGGRGYHVQSLYFDDPSLTYYRQKSAGHSERAKFRLRVYGEVGDAPDRCFLEEKGRRNDMVFKNRAPVPFMAIQQAEEQHANISAHLLEHVRGSVIAGAFSHGVYVNGIRPVILLSYNRRAYRSSQSPNFRVTFDEDIVAHLTHSVRPSPHTLLRRLFAGYTVLEVKFTHRFPRWFLRFIHDYDLHRKSVSKVYSGIEAFTPELVRDMLR